MKIFTACVLFFVYCCPCTAVVNEFEHVALFRCDQVNRRVDLALVAKGDAKKITAMVMELKDVFIFNRGTLKQPKSYSLFLVCWKQDTSGSTRGAIFSWVTKDKPLTLMQLKNMNLPDKGIDSLLKYDFANHSP